MSEAAILDHEFLVAAYVVVWVIQLSYLAYLGYRWRAQKAASRRVSKSASQRS